MLHPGRKVGARTSAAVASLGLCVAAFTFLGTTAAADGERPVTTPIAALQQTPVTQYRAFRRMHAQSERFNQEAWVDCWTELDEHGFRYEIVSERGSDYIREKILKALLRREQEIIAAGSANRADLSDANYEFATGADAAAPSGERTVLIKPRRKDVLLVNGRMVLSQDGTELLRVEGRLAKNPSFWTSLVDIVREFAKVDGVRVPVATDTVAKIKFAGTSRMDVRYQYETINGRPVTDAGRQIASAAPAR